MSNWFLEYIERIIIGFISGLAGGIVISVSAFNIPLRSQFPIIFKAVIILIIVGAFGVGVINYFKSKEVQKKIIRRVVRKPRKKTELFIPYRIKWIFTLLVVFVFVLLVLKIITPLVSLVSIVLIFCMPSMLVVDKLLDRIKQVSFSSQGLTIMATDVGRSPENIDLELMNPMEGNDE